MELAVAGSAVEWAVAGTVGKHVGQAQAWGGWGACPVELW